MRSVLLAAAFLTMATQAVFAFSCTGFDCVAPDPTKVSPTDILKSVPGWAPLVEAAKHSGDQNLVGAAQNLEALGAKLDKETQKAISNALTNPAEGIKDTVQTHVKAANDLVDAVHASARYAKRTVNGYGDVLSKNERRAREGKVVDAIWHIQMDSLKSDNKNASKLMQESELIRQAAQAAVSTYAGPAGTAAFAAWMAYNQSEHNVEAALRAGAYTYLVTAGYAKVNTLPSGTVDEVVQKAAATAAIRGLAVAAAGGSQQDMFNAAIQGGGSIIVQAGQSYVNQYGKEYADPSAARADTFCMDAVKESCADAKQWLADSQDQLKQYTASADLSPNIAATDDGQWAISWDKKALLDHTSVAPGVVLTYVGEGSPFNYQMNIISSLGEPPGPPPGNYLYLHPSNWAAFSAPGGDTPYFDILKLDNGLRLPGSVIEGDVLTAKTDVDVRPGPYGGGWGAPIDYIASGEVITVLDVNTAHTAFGPQDWILFSRNQW